MTTPAEARRTTLAVSIGNTVETRDYAVYGCFTTVLAKVFFPDASAGAAPLSSFAVFDLIRRHEPAQSVVFSTVEARP